MLKSEARADEYRAQASQAALLAQSCGLPQVREKHELAACAWLVLARVEDQRSAAARRLTARAPVRPGARADDVVVSD